MQIPPVVILSTTLGATFGAVATLCLIYLLNRHEIHESKKSSAAKSKKIDDIDDLGSSIVTGTDEEEKQQQQQVVENEATGEYTTRRHIRNRSRVNASMAQKSVTMVENREAAASESNSSNSNDDEHQKKEQHQGEDGDQQQPAKQDDEEEVVEEDYDDMIVNEDVNDDMIIHDDDNETENNNDGGGGEKTNNSEEEQEANPGDVDEDMIVYDDDDLVVNEDVPDTSVSFVSSSSPQLEIKPSLEEQEAADENCFFDDADDIIIKDDSEFDNGSVVSSSPVITNMAPTPAPSPAHFLVEAQQNNTSRQPPAATEAAADDAAGATSTGSSSRKTRNFRNLYKSLKMGDVEAVRRQMQADLAEKEKKHNDRQQEKKKAREVLREEIDEYEQRIKHQEQKLRLQNSAATRPHSTTPYNKLRKILSGYQISRAVHVAAQLDLAAHLQNGPKHISELATLCECDKDSMYRLLRCLASVGVFREIAIYQQKANGTNNGAGNDHNNNDDVFTITMEGEGFFENTPMSSYLIPGKSHSLRSEALLHANQHYKTFEQLFYAVKTGKNAFEKTFGTDLLQFYAPANTNTHSKDDDDEHASFSLAADFENSLSIDEEVNEKVSSLIDFSTHKRIVELLVPGTRGAVVPPASLLLFHIVDHLLAAAEATSNLARSRRSHHASSSSSSSRPLRRGKGGNGNANANSSEAEPFVSSGGVLFASADIIERAALTYYTMKSESFRKRCELVAGSPLADEAEIPQGDCYILNNALHDLDDDKCLRVLQNIRRSSSSSSSSSSSTSSAELLTSQAATTATTTTLIIVDNIVSPSGDNSKSATKMADLSHLVLTGNAGSRERTKKQFEDLLHRSGFAIERIIHHVPTPARRHHVSIIVATPTTTITSSSSSSSSSSS